MPNASGKVFAILCGNESQDLQSFAKNVFSWSFQSALNSIESIEKIIPPAVMQSKVASPKPLIAVVLSYKLAIYLSCIERFLHVSEKKSAELLESVIGCTTNLKYPDGAPIFAYIDYAFFEKSIKKYKIEILDYLHENEKGNLTYGPGFLAINDIFVEYSLPDWLVDIFEKMRLYKYLEVSVEAIVEAVFLQKLIALA